MAYARIWKKVGTDRRGSKWQPTHIRAEIVKCHNYIDDDGVLNDDDECPSTSGNIHNFGCPGTPDLMVDERETRQVSDCYESTLVLSMKQLF